jgi:hypothetical protein
MQQSLFNVRKTMNGDQVVNPKNIKVFIVSFGPSHLLSPRLYPIHDCIPRTSTFPKEASAHFLHVESFPVTTASPYIDVRI